MQNPLPSRRSIHAAGRPAAERPAPERRVPKRPTAGRPGSGRRVKPQSSAAPGTMVMIAGIVGVILFVFILAAGFVSKNAVRPPVLVVEGVLDPVQVAGRHGALPVLSLSEPVEVASTKVRPQLLGEGREITEQSPVLISITAFDGEDGENLNPDGRPTLVLARANEEELGATLTDVLLGETEGSRLIVARPLADGKTEIDVVDILYSIARGTPGGELAEGPLSVDFSADQPVVTHEAGDPPSTLVTQVLIQGNGPQVEDNGEVVLQYNYGKWSDLTITSSSWGEGFPKVVALADAMPGVRNALIDQRVGSRLALTIPAELATGEDTVFAVVDILGTKPPALEAATDDEG